MLRVHIVQMSYNPHLSGVGPIPYESTILHFRYLPEPHGLGQDLFGEISGRVEE